MLALIYYCSPGNFNRAWQSILSTYQGLLNKCAAIGWKEWNISLTQIGYKPNPWVSLSKSVYDLLCRLRMRVWKSLGLE